MEKESWLVELPKKELIFDRIAKITSWENTSYVPEDEMELCRCYDELGQLYTAYNNSLLSHKMLLEEETAQRTLELKAEKEGTKNKYTEAQIDAIIFQELQGYRHMILADRFSLDAIVEKKNALEKYITCVRDFMKASTWSSV